MTPGCLTWWLLGRCVGGCSTVRRRHRALLRWRFLLISSQNQFTSVHQNKHVIYLHVFHYLTTHGPGGDDRGRPGRHRIGQLHPEGRDRRRRLSLGERPEESLSLTKRFDKTANCSAERSGSLYLVTQPLPSLLCPVAGTLRHLPLSLFLSLPLPLLLCPVLSISFPDQTFQPTLQSEDSST